MGNDQAPEPVRLQRGDHLRRAQQAWDLRVQGYDWPTIAEQCGYSSKSAALRSVRRLRQSLPEVDVAELREGAIARALVLIRHAADDVQERRPGAVTAQVRAEGRLAALCGLDAPDRQEVFTHHGLDGFWATIYAHGEPPRFGELPSAIVDAEVIELEVGASATDDT